LSSAKSAIRRSSLDCSGVSAATAEAPYPVASTASSRSLNTMANRGTVELDDIESRHHHHHHHQPQSISSASDNKTGVVATTTTTSSSPVVQETYFSQTGIFATLRHYEALLDAKLGVESHGPDRILPEARNPPRTWVMAFIWASATMNLSAYATGFIGYALGLNLMQSILITVFGTLLGAMVTAWCATLGAPTGLRQVSIARYSFGWYPSKIIAVLNVIAQIGWSSVGAITGGLALSAVSDGRVSLLLGVVIVAVVPALISFVGLRAVLKYDEYSWMVYFVIFIIIFGFAGPAADADVSSQLSGDTLTGTVLTLLGIVYGSSASWSSIVSDYYVHYPTSVAPFKVFILTALGIGLPTIIAITAGAVTASSPFLQLRMTVGLGS
jgi:hypothetical protein